LSEVDADYILVLFWATHCEHCMEMMAGLHEWYVEDRPENIEVFAVSIDTVAADWHQYSRVADPPWINTREPMGWEGKSAEDYNIYATPTMFLLDRERRIVARPFTLRELRREIRRL
jgi:thiol-disulfide isomerase/thioredoxin